MGMEVWGNRDVGKVLCTQKKDPPLTAGGLWTLLVVVVLGFLINKLLDVLQLELRRLKI